MSFFEIIVFHNYIIWKYKVDHILCGQSYWTYRIYFFLNIINSAIMNIFMSKY